ncbi:ATP-binding protein [Nitrogeniibacter aestuarii]|uniref:ATP-binding protein n=1 Tax=Nitrogeniibacter aestuarii TaxID=2815343 RepID=UPI001E3DA3B0|nr:ATP-binding protein [Nitrogeniibacter aestuarii]
MIYSPAHAPSFDLGRCEAEPIHLLGQVQSHGFVLVLDENETVVAISGNLEALVGRIAQQAQRPLQLDDLPEHMAELIRDHRADVAEQDDSPGVYCGFCDCGPDGQGRASRYELVLRKNAQGLLLVDFLPWVESGARRNEAVWLQHEIHRMLNTLSRLDSIERFADTLATEFKRFSGYDRVMIYRFDEDHNGEVIAEALEDGLEPYKGLHYPASDIPAQARALYVSNRVRHVFDVEDVGEALWVNADQPGPVDLSHSFLRSVSPIHIQYLKNMGVRATLTVSLIVDGALWGLIACHHNSAKAAPYAFLNSTKFLSRIVSSELVRVIQHESERQFDLLAEIQTQLIGKMNRTDRFMEALVGPQPNITQLLNADSAMVFFSSDVFTIGDAPTKEEASRLLAWVKAQVKPSDMIYTSTRLPHEYPAAEGFKHVASGVIVLFLSFDRNDAVMWFRKGVVETVSWAGDPRKAVVADPAGQMSRLQPRASFDEWKEVRSGISRPWTAAELHTAKSLRNPIVEMTLKQGVLLEKLNQELVQARNDAVLANQRKTDAISNMSHEVRTPLNSIIGYTELLKYGKAGALTEDQQRYINYAADNARHLLSIINDILDIAKIEAGSLALHREPTNVVAVMDESLMLVQPLFNEKQVTLGKTYRDETGLVVHGDRKRLKQVFVNLLSNAAKYNKPQGGVEVKLYLETVDGRRYAVIDVHDSGIGMSDDQLEKLFSRFYRVESGEHRKVDGTGLGLSITKQLVELHQGYIQVSSKLGIGSQFKVYLPVSI